jgi:hypothetical protein
MLRTSANFQLMYVDLPEKKIRNMHLHISTLTLKQCIKDKTYNIRYKGQDVRGP